VLRFASDTFADTVVQFAHSITYSTHGKDYLEPVCGKGDYYKPGIDKATGQVGSSGVPTQGTISRTLLRRFYNGYACAQVRCAATAASRP
jgi:hypothetical protein